MTQLRVTSWRPGCGYWRHSGPWILTREIPNEVRRSWPGFEYDIDVTPVRLQQAREKQLIIDYRCLLKVKVAIVYTVKLKDYVWMSFRTGNSVPDLKNELFLPLSSSLSCTSSLSLSLCVCVCVCNNQAINLVCRNKQLFLYHLYWCSSLTLSLCQWFNISRTLHSHCIGWWFHSQWIWHRHCVSGFTVHGRSSQTLYRSVISQSMAFTPSLCQWFHCPWASRRLCISDFTVHERYTGSEWVVSYSTSLTVPLY